MPWENERSRRGKDGERWHFHYWYAEQAVRLFFWNDARTQTGVILFLPGKTISYKRVADKIDKIVANEKFRHQHLRDLVFPLEKHYDHYPVFPEEAEAAASPVDPLSKR